MQVALSEFLSRVESIEGTIELRDRLVDFGRLTIEDVGPQAALLHQSVRQLGLAGMQTSLNGSVLLLAAAFEQFVTDMLIAFTVSLPDIVPAYEDLPNAVRSANERLTGEALSRSQSRFTAYDLQRFVQNLGNCQSGFVPYVLNGEAMALNDRNLRVGRLRELIGRLGIPDIWSVVGSTQTLKDWSGPGGNETAETRAKNQLNELIENRNQIAHGIGSTTLGPEAILSYIEFERALARSLVSGLEDYATAL